MHAHDFLVDEGDEWHVVEAIVECLPEGELVPSLDLVEEAINAGDRLTFVVAAQHDYLFWEANLESKKEADDLAALLTSVDVITEEEVTQVSTQNLILLVLLVFICHFFEHVQQVAVLAVYVTEDLHRRLEHQQWLLVLEYFLDLLEKVLDDLLGQVDEWYILWILSLVINNFVVKVVDNDIGNEFLLVRHIGLRDHLKGLFELFAPNFLDVE